MLKTLSRSIREYKIYAILAPLTMVGEVLMEVLIPTIIAGLMDNGVEARNLPFALTQGLYLAGCALLSLVFGCLSAVFASKASTGFAKNLRQDMFHKVQDFSFSNIDKFSTSSIVTRLTTDVTHLQMAFQVTIRMAIRCPVMLVMALIMALRISPRLTLVYCGVLPLLLLGIILLVRVIRPVFTRIFATYDRMNNVVQENLRGIRVVKAFVREEKEEEKFSAVSGDIYKDFVKAERVMALGSPLMQFCAYTCMIALSWFGAKMIWQSGNLEAFGLTTGQLSSLFNYTMQILSSLMMVSMIFVMLTMSAASARRSVEILTEEPAVRNPENPVMEVKDGSVDFENVSFRYAKTAERDCLSQVDLHIAPGMTVGVLGGTGSSKTTLVQLIPRLYDVTGGSLKVGGVDVRDYDVETLRNAVAMVLQKNVLFSGTVRENLRWGNENATDAELEHACRLACAHDFVTQFPGGYDEHIEQGGTNVSGGQRQRLCIARALLKKPKILILDDSTSAVDTRTDALIRQALREEIPDTTKIIIAQRVASVEHADLILVLDGGRIVAQGTHETLLADSPIYREVYESQTKGGGEDGQTR